MPLLQKFMMDSCSSVHKNTLLAAKWASNGHPDSMGQLICALAINCCRLVCGV